MEVNTQFLFCSWVESVVKQLLSGSPRKSQLICARFCDAWNSCFCVGGRSKFCDVPYHNDATRHPKQPGTFHLAPPPNIWYHVAFFTGVIQSKQYVFSFNRDFCCCCSWKGHSQRRRAWLEKSIEVLWTEWIQKRDDCRPKTTDSFDKNATAETWPEIEKSQLQ